MTKGNGSAEKIGMSQNVTNESDLIKTLQDNARIENQVRRRLQDVLSSAGMSSDGVAKEVLFWMPSEFVDFYSDLFLRALELKGRSALSTGGSGAGGDRVAELGKAVVNEKEYKGKRVGAGAGGLGKRFYRGEWIIKDEKAFGLLGEVNEALMATLVGSLGFLTTLGMIERTKAPLGTIIHQEMDGKRNGEGKLRRICGDCRKLMKAEWMRCPFHE
jgi:hypothetical protein